MALQLETKNGVGLITLSGSFDAAAVQSLGQQANAWIEALADTRQVVVDLGAVTFMDSAGLGALIGMLRRLASRGGDLRLARPRSSVKLVLDITRASRIFSIVATVEGALAAAAAAHP